MKDITTIESILNWIEEKEELILEDISDYSSWFVLNLEQTSCYWRVKLNDDLIMSDEDMEWNEVTDDDYISIEITLEKKFQEYLVKLEKTVKLFKK